MGNMGGRSPAPLIRTGFKAEIVQDGDMTGTERMEPAKLPTSNNRSGTAPGGAIRPTVTPSCHTSSRHGPFPVASTSSPATN